VPLSIGVVFSPSGTMVGLADRPRSGRAARSYFGRPAAILVRAAATEGFCTPQGGRPQKKNLLLWKISDKLFCRWQKKIIRRGPTKRCWRTRQSAGPIAGGMAARPILRANCNLVVERGQRPTYCGPLVSAGLPDRRPCCRRERNFSSLGSRLHNAKSIFVRGSVRFF